MRPVQWIATGLLAWKRGQPGQVGNEAALTVATSAEVRLVTFPSFFTCAPARPSRERERRLVLPASRGGLRTVAVPTPDPHT